jgi:hypothetical protein
MAAQPAAFSIAGRSSPSFPHRMPGNLGLACGGAAASCSAIRSGSALERTNQPHFQHLLII